MLWERLALWSSPPAQCPRPAIAEHGVAPDRSSGAAHRQRYAAVFFKNEVKLGAAFQVEFWFRPDQIARPGFVPVLDMQFAIAHHTVYLWFGLLDGEAAFGVYPDGGYA